MLTTARSFIASQRDASRAVERAEKFAVRLPVVGRVSVPPPDQLAFYAILGVLAAVEAIDWPVALATGVGQAVVARHFADEEPAPARQQGAPARKTAPRKAAAKKAAPRRAATKKAAPRKAAKSAKPR